MKFIDLFAGLGSFHVALKKLGMDCVFACEIDTNLRELYEANFTMKCHGDITQINAKEIPSHDILCAGFPCQPFSKAGKQKGLNDEKRGLMINEIIRILKFHKPNYFILENVPNLKNHDQGKTWQYIESLLSDSGYTFKDNVLSPHHFGIPHRRDRIFITGQRKKIGTINFEIIKNNKPKPIESFLSENKNSDKLLPHQIECLDTWQNFIKSLPKNKPLPKFPIWAMEFGATYPLETKTPHCLSKQELGQYRGMFGKKLSGLSKEEQLKNLPRYAIYEENFFPKWKINYLKKNRIFWNENKLYIKHLIPKIKGFITSWQKLEWNAGDDTRNIYKYFIQFRSSGVRVKNCSSIPSLVLTNTQRPIIGWKKRYLSLKEAQHLQGLDSLDLKILSDKKAFEALGNAVNSVVVENIIDRLVNT